MASGCVTKVINNFFKEIFLVFSIVLGKDSSIFLEFNIIRDLLDPCLGIYLGVLRSCPPY